MPRSATKQSPRHALDLDEIAPNRFLVHNARVISLLKGEGALAGRLFNLTTWRREGLLARLRGRGFAVRTLMDRIAELPAPPPAPPIGEPVWRPLASEIDQFSHFDPERVGWRPVERETRDGVAGVLVRVGWVLRRRKGRGASSYHLAFRERGGGAGLRALDETTAILLGYAQAHEYDDRAWLVERRRAPRAGIEGDGVLLPDVVLPPAYREVLDLLAHATDEGPWVESRAWPLAQALFGRLGVRLNVESLNEE